MSRIKKVLLVLIAVFIVIQFIRPARNISSGQVSVADIQHVVAVPQNVQTVLKTACYDCHSNNTKYPWYMNVEPAGWLMAHHVNNGKAELNFSEFGLYTIRRQKSKLKSIASQIDDGEMPLSSYTLIHRNAILSKDQKALIINWATAARDSLSAKR